MRYIAAETPIRLLDVLSENEELIVTKNFVPFARIERVGPMYGSVKIVGDVVEPACDLDEWTLDEDNLK